MKINSQYSTSITYARTNRILSKKNTENFSNSLAEKNIEQVDINKKDIWADLAKTYNIRNASFDELCNISMELYQAGQISSFDHAMLTFDPSKSPQPIKYNLCLTEANTDGRRDWIAEYEARSKRDLEVGNMIGYRNNKNIEKILRRIK